jgi:squalene-hopene/tetraprenyl-beta-curcumene cyclase
MVLAKARRGSEPPPGDVTRLSAHSAMLRACSYLAEVQEADGAWREPPEPRLLENGLMCVLAARYAPDLTELCALARSFVAQAPIQTHHVIPTVIESWLREATLAGPAAATLDLRDSAFSEPVYENRKLFFGSVALALGSPVPQADRRRTVERLGSVLESRRTSNLKAWSSAEIASLYLLLTPDAQSEMTDLALRTLEEVQSSTGSFGDNPLSTVVALAALTVWEPDGPVRRRAFEYLRDVQTSDGTWRFSIADVWDTALMRRAFAKASHLMPTVWSNAETFISAAQNADGGFPYRVGVESDTDTTGMSMLALAGSTHARETAERAQRYLANTRTADGLWRTWHYKDDPPAEDAVAHAVLGLKASNAPEELWRKASEWLATRAKHDVGWRAHWYNIQAYAAHEVGLVLGRSHPATRYAARLVAEQQNADGGWGVAAGSASTAPATGLATSLLLDYFPIEHPLIQRAVRYLVDAQAPNGAWVGATDMYAPRPFAVDYPFQTHALAALGVIGVATKPRPATRERRQQRSAHDFLSVALPRA